MIKNLLILKNKKSMKIKQDNKIKILKYGKINKILCIKSAIINMKKMNYRMIQIEGINHLFWVLYKIKKITLLLLGIHLLLIKDKSKYEDFFRIK